MSDTSIPVAFGAGVISFLSPCVLPMVPVYLANMAGVSVLEPDSKTSFRKPLSHALVFVAGFSLIFSAIGASAGLIGFAIDAHIDNRIAGVVLIFFGLFLLASLRIPRLNFQKHVDGGLITSTGYIRSFSLGAAFSLGWTPCIGPILGGILTLAADSGTAWQGTYLLLIYSLGLGLPFIIMSFAVGSISRELKRFNRYTPLVSLVGGALLIIIGILMYTDQLAKLAN